MGPAQQLAALVEEYRDRCLWFQRRDYVPQTRQEMLHVLDLIERYGDSEAYRRAEELKVWLLRDSRAVS